MSFIEINSEIGELEGVILHTPGVEIESMTPSNIQQALYSDLLNLNIASKEYSNFSGVLSRWTKTYQVKDLLSEILKNKEVKASLINKILKAEKKEYLFAEFIDKNEEELAKIFIEGYKYREGVFNPLYNLFFTRDASSSVYDKVLIHSMSTDVRDRESFIMEAIFKNYFNTETINPRACEGAHTEGGDVLIAREDVLFIGNGCRTNKTGIDFLTKYYAARKEKQHIIVQELPEKPESFIHLDMVFTMLAQDRCMMYEPIIKNALGKFNVTHIEIDNGQIHYHQRSNMLEATKKLGFDFNPILCGGDDAWYQEREQWHSGANFFCLGEGKILGYARNTRTIEALNNAGFEVLRAEDVCQDKVNMRDYERFVVTFDAAELPRGGGGARCMTMPIKRKKVNW